MFCELTHSQQKMFKFFVLSESLSGTTTKKVDGRVKYTLLLTIILMFLSITSVYGAELTSPITSGTYADPTTVTITGSLATDTYGVFSNGSSSQVIFLDDAEVIVNKTNTGAGPTFGLISQTGAKLNFTGSDATVKVNVTNAGTGATYGAHAIQANSLMTFDGNSEFTVTKTGSGTSAVYGLRSLNGAKTNFTNANATTVFNVNNYGSGDTDGIATQEANSSITFAGDTEINVNKIGAGTGNAAGIYVYNGGVVNFTKNSSDSNVAINVDNAGTGNAFGVYLYTNATASFAGNADITVINNGSNNVVAGLQAYIGTKYLFTNPDATVTVNVTNNGTGTSTDHQTHGVYIGGKDALASFAGTTNINVLKTNANNAGHTYGILTQNIGNDGSLSSTFNNVNVVVDNYGTGASYGAYAVVHNSLITFNGDILNINVHNYNPLNDGNTRGLMADDNALGISFTDPNATLILNVISDGPGRTEGVVAGLNSPVIFTGNVDITAKNTNTNHGIALYGLRAFNGGSISIAGNTRINAEHAGYGTAFGLRASAGSIYINESQTKTTQITGAVTSTDNGEIVVNFTNVNSYLIGLLDSDASSTLDMVLSNLATWKPTENDDSINNANLTVANGIIDLSWWELSKLPARAPFDVAFRDITLSDLAIDGVATLIINSDVKGDQADRFIVDNLHDGGTATATQYLQVAYDKAIENYAFESIKGSIGGYYLLKGDDLIEVLTVNNNEDNINIDFRGLESTIDGVLTQFKVMPDVYDETVDGVFHGYLGGLFVAPTDDPSETVKTFSDNVASLHWMTRLSNDNFVARLGDLRRFDNDNLLGVWAKFSSGTLNTTNETFNRDIRDDYFIAQAGFDKVFIKEDSKIYAGLMLQYFEDDSRYVNGEGNVDSIGFGGYGSWTNKNSYIDVTVKASNVKSDYKLVNSNDERISGEYDAWGVMLNGEYGVYLPVNADINILPSIQLTYNTYEDLKHTTSNGISVNSYDNDSLILRVGTDLNCEFEDGNLYFGANVYHNFMKSPTTTMSYQGVDMDVKSEISNTWFKFALGGNVKAAKDVNLYMEFSTLVDGGFGNCDINSNWQATIGARYSF